MSTHKVSFSVHSIVFTVLSCCCCYANAQDGIKAQVAGIREQLVRIEGGVDKLGESVNEIATANRQICDRPVSWNRKLPDGDRFALALNGHAYCDLETGLIWAEEPTLAHVSWKQAFANHTDAAMAIVTQFRTSRARTFTEPSS